MDSGIEPEAAHWIARRLSDEPFDMTGFDAWLAGDPRRGAIFDAMWRRIGGPGMDEALNAYDRRRRVQRRAKAAASAAAAVLIAAGTYAALPAVDLALARPRDFEAPGSAVREVALEDGTRLTLAGGAGVRVRYTRYGRQVELVRGTIFADVVHDPNRPFCVQAGDGQITDLGTSFEVSRKPAMIHVAVETGVVGFGPSGWFSKRIALTAHQAAVLTEDGLSRVANAGSPGNIAQWRSGWAEYHDAPMRQVIADLEAVSPMAMEIDSKDLAESRISGRIKLTDPINQLRNLAIIHRFIVRRVGSKIILLDG